MRIIKPLIAAVALIILVSCGQQAAYDNYIDTNVTGWSKDSAVSFSVEMNDTVSTYRVLTVVRHISTYPYQNFWMFLNSKSPEGYVAKDTIECFLADNRGKWLGNGLLSQHEMPVIYMDHIKFPQIGTYRFDIYQGMRDSVITGISAIGLIIEKQDNGKE